MTEIDERFTLQYKENCTANVTTMITIDSMNIVWNKLPNIKYYAYILTCQHTFAHREPLY